MKKFISIILALAIVMSLGACSAKKDKKPVSDQDSSVTETPNETQTPSVKPSDTPDTSVKPEPSKKPVTSTHTPTPTPEQTPAEEQKSLSAIMSTILKGVELPKLMSASLTSDMFKSYLFIDPIDGAEALASDAAIGSIAHSVVLLRLPEGSDVSAVTASIESNADPRKWICVEAEKVIVSTKGNLVLLVMSTTASADSIAANFNSLA